MHTEKEVFSMSGEVAIAISMQRVIASYKELWTLCSHFSLARDVVIYVLWALASPLCEVFN